MSEADTRAKLIDPAIHARGWTEDLITREERDGAIELVDGKPRRSTKKPRDYVLRVRVHRDTQSVAVALIEAKPEHKPPAHGLEQGKGYARNAKRLRVPFVFSSNGHLYVEYDQFTGLTSRPRPLHEFPTPEELRERYERGMGFTLDSAPAKPLLVPYSGGETARRYYQDAAIRAAFEKIATGERRVLLSLATGSGKTRIATHLLKRLADAGQLKRALFVCDRDELRTQALTAFQNIFGTDAQAASGSHPEKNARIVIATYQTICGKRDDGTTYLAHHYPENYFSHVIIDECHRSAWGEWREVLTRNANAVRIGLTATPRTVVEKIKQGDLPEDTISPDNIAYFGDPVYEYDIGQGIADGYLAAMEVRQFDLFHDNKQVNEREGGVAREDLQDKQLRDADTGEALTIEEAREQYGADAIEDRIVMPERVRAMCADLFRQLIETGGPEQKTIIFCRRDRHADDVAAEMNNLYAAWCKTVLPLPQRQGELEGVSDSHLPVGRGVADPYAFKCTAKVSGSDFIADFRGAQRHHFIAATVDLLSTGVDVPNVRNVVFFRYLKSPIMLHQMVGRGTRIDAASGKLAFRVYDYTNVMRLFGEPFNVPPPRSGTGGEGPTPPPEKVIEVEGIEVRITDAGTSIAVQDDGKFTLIPLEEYRERVAARLVEEAPTLDAFRERWVDPSARQELLKALPNGGASLQVVQRADNMGEYDRYDILAALAYGLAAKTRQERAEAFTYKHEKWLAGLPANAADTIRALAMQFRRNGTEELENRYIFETPEVISAGGLPALKPAGDPAALLREVKGRMFEV